VVDEPSTDRCLDPSDLDLLARLASGVSVADVGAELGLSTRTIHRRLRMLRTQLSIDTNRELIVRYGM
jgi:DNA-binding NarL/FixJ family response regulator